jgi:hypothetical protein
MYIQIVAIYYSVIFVSVKVVYCKHNMCIITSEMSTFNFGYPSTGQYIYVSEDVRIHGYFSNPEGVLE